MGILSNPGTAYNESLLTSCPYSVEEANAFTKKITEDASKLEKSEKQELMIKAVTLIDLTTLNADDTPESVINLAKRAAAPIPSHPEIVTAGVCVYPLRVPDVITGLKSANATGKISVASVAGGFPSGQFRLETRVEEVRLAVADGADDVDIVINRSAAVSGDWKVVYDEVKAMKAACGGKASLKVILATGELKSLDNIFKASLVAMMAGGDFIKTSTGKEAVNATLETAYVMCQAIKMFHDSNGIEVGFKPAGGLKTSNDALGYILTVRQILGEKWLDKNHLRLGASSLLDSLLADIE